MDIINYLIDIASRNSLGTGWNEVGIHHIPENGGYNAHVSVKLNDFREITDFMIAPVSDNPQGSHDHIYNVDTGNPGREYRSKFDW